VGLSSVTQWNGRRGDARKEKIMAALVSSTYGLDTAVYDQIAAGVTDSLRAAPGAVTG
jgi:hypothetical protein